MTLQEFTSFINNSDRVQIIKDNKLIYAGYLAFLKIPHGGAEEHTEKYDRYKDDEVKKFRAVPEVVHNRWHELGLKKPIEPQLTPDYKFSDLQLKIYYAIYI